MIYTQKQTMKILEWALKFLGFSPVMAGQTFYCSQWTIYEKKGMTVKIEVNKDNI